MGGSMMIFRLVAATDVSARHAGPQVYPCVSRFEAFLTAGGGGLDVIDLIQVCAGGGHGV